MQATPHVPHTPLLKKKRHQRVEDKPGRQRLNGLVTRDLATNPDELGSMPPYMLFAQNTLYSELGGLANSFCGLNTNAQIQGTSKGRLRGMIATGMAKRGTEKSLRQEFHVSGLNASSKYTGVLVQARTDSQGKRDNVPGGGGVVYRQIDFNTKQGE